jgi:hypothetical protein
MLGLPLLVLLLPAVGFGWLLSEGWMRGMLLMFLGMYGVGAWSAFRHHRRRSPGLVAVISGALLIGTSWHLVPRAAAWVALVGLALAWFLDQRGLRRVCHAPLAPHA